MRIFSLFKVGGIVDKLDVATLSFYHLFSIGNSLEVIEAVETLKGRGPKDLTEVCTELAAYMLSLAGKGSVETCRQAFCP